MNIQTEHSTLQASRGTENQETYVLLDRWPNLWHAFNGVAAVLAGFLVLVKALHLDSRPSESWMQLLLVFMAIGIIVMVLTLLVPGGNYLAVDREGFTVQYGVIRRRRKWAECREFAAWKQTFIGNLSRNWVVYDTKKDGHGFHPIGWLSKRKTGYTRGLPSTYKLAAGDLAALLETLRQSFGEEGNRNGAPSLQDVIADVAPQAKALSRKRLNVRRWLLAIVVAEVAFVGGVGISNALPTGESACWNGTGQKRLIACTRIIEAKRLLGRPISTENLAIMHTNRGRSLIEMPGKLQHALAEFNTAIALDPDYAYPYKMRGTVRKNQDRMRAAINDYTKALQFAPTDIYALHMRARVYEEVDKPKLAMAGYEKTFELGGAERIRAMQNRMKRRGVYLGQVNGVYDGRTRSALMRCVARPNC